MTIIARVDSLNEAYRGMALLRAKAIPPQLVRDGDKLVLGVEDDFASNAKTALLTEGSLGRHLTEEDKHSGGRWSSFEYLNT